MNREIKFRGISKKTGKWIHGYYLKNRGVDFIAPDEFAGDKTWEDYEVIPETVGQFTGLLDKNGKEIYEGDIIQFQFTQFSSCSSKLFLSEQFIGIITIDKWNNHIIKSDGLEIHISNACEYGVVIGNIHDTPELLKTETL